MQKKHKGEIAAEKKGIPHEEKRGNRNVEKSMSGRRKVANCDGEKARNPGGEKWVNRYEENVRIAKIVLWDIAAELRGVVAEHIAKKASKETVRYKTSFRTSKSR